MFAATSQLPSGRTNQGNTYIIGCAQIKRSPHRQAVQTFPAIVCVVVVAKSGEPLYRFPQNGYSSSCAQRTRQRAARRRASVGALRIDAQEKEHFSLPKSGALYRLPENGKGLPWSGSPSWRGDNFVTSFAVTAFICNDIAVQGKELFEAFPRQPTLVVVGVGNAKCGAQFVKIRQPVPKAFDSAGYTVCLWCG